MRRRAQVSSRGGRGAACGGVGLGAPDGRRRALEPTLGDVLRLSRDPAAMTSQDRLAELGHLLALGYRRLQLHGKGLAENGDGERTCDPAVDGNGAKSAEEVA